MSIYTCVNPFLVKLGDKLLVLDTGLGYSNSEGQLILHENIRKAGFDPDDVDYVLMSHLHFDHAGGMVHKENNGMELSFPNATYVIQRGEWGRALLQIHHLLTELKSLIFCSVTRLCFL
ncbi:MBL fold metallo-hydrolase [Pedobacter sp. NJ-S-72]